MGVVSKIRPNSARMWDYMMGGAHNFGVDRAAVKVARTLYPRYEESMRAQRQFLQRAVTYMVKEKGIDRFVDFGSGLPTRGNVHEIVQAINPKAKVIYSDKDPIAVAFGKQILGNTPHVLYLRCDVTEPAEFLESPEVAAFLGDRRVGVGFVGVFLYVPDGPLAAFFRTLYDWVSPGSCIAVTYAGKKVSSIDGVEEASRMKDMVFYSRSRQEALNIIGPWKVEEPGIVDGFYWGMPADSPEINTEILNLSRCFVAYK